MREYARIRIAWAGMRTNAHIREHSRRMRGSARIAYAHIRITWAEMRAYGSIWAHVLASHQNARIKDVWNWRCVISDSCVNDFWLTWLSNTAIARLMAAFDVITM